MIQSTMAFLYAAMLEDYCFFINRLRLILKSS